jgi:hypothetical protein
MTFGEEGVILAGEEHSETRTRPLCSLAGPNVGWGWPSSVSVQRRNRFKVEGKGRSCENVEHRKSERDGIRHVLQRVEVVKERGCGHCLWSSAEFPWSGLGSQQHQGQP